MEATTLQKRSLLSSEVQRVWAIAWPLILTNMLNVSVGIVDFKMVGALGVAPIAAVGMARQVMMFLQVLMIAISGGSSVLVAHAYGAKEPHKVSQIAARSIVFMLLTALLIVTPLGLVFSRSILTLLGGEAQIVQLGESYLKILFWGSIFNMFNFAITGILLGVGKTKISLILLVGVNLLNIGFNYMLIFGIGPIPAFGVAGAALGTVIARGLGSFVGVWIVTTPRFPIQAKYKDGLTVDLPLLRKILYLGGPRSLQGIVRNFSALMTIRIITLLPDAIRAISAYSVGIQVRMISSFIGLAFMSAAMARVGQNMGGRNPDLAEKSGWISAGMASGFMSIFAILFFLFPDVIMAFFTDDREVIAMGKVFFVIIALTEPIMAFSFALGGALRGGGDPVSPFQLGFAGIALGIALSAVTRAIPTMLKFRKGDWKTMIL
jgi:putative MATE family efflux protein